MTEMCCSPVFSRALGDMRVAGRRYAGGSNDKHQISNESISRCSNQRAPNVTHFGERADMRESALTAISCCLERDWSWKHLKERSFLVSLQCFCN